MMESRPVIAVIGGRKVDKSLLKVAEEVGRLLAERGSIVACGGLGGVMEAVSKGAKSAGGLTIGILPQEHKRDVNAYIDVPRVYVKNIRAVAKCIFLCYNLLVATLTDKEGAS